MNFSLEIGPHTDLGTLPPVKDVYVTMLLGGDYKVQVSDKGISHFAHVNKQIEYFIALEAK